MGGDAPFDLDSTTPVPVDGPLSRLVPYARRVESFPLVALYRAHARWLAVGQRYDRAGDEPGRQEAERRLAIVLAELDRREEAAKAEDRRRAEAIRTRYPARAVAGLLGLPVPSGAALTPVRGGGRRGR